VPVTGVYKFGNKGMRGFHRRIQRGQRGTSKPTFALTWTMGRIIQGFWRTLSQGTIKTVMAGGIRKVTLAHLGTQDAYMTMPKLFRGPLEYNWIKT
jgi:hypothetical protein